MLLAAIISSLVFLVSLGLILSEKVHRTIIAVAGAVVMVGVGLIFGFYSEAEALEAVDFNTLGLLLGMMILVALLEPTGFFQYLAVWAGRFSKGRPVRLLVLLGTITTVVSMFLDNVTTVVLIAPVTILICEILGTNPAPYLMAEALLSDTGGVATLVGDPPNVLIASAAGLSFVDFLVNALPIVLVAWLVALLLLRILFRKELAVQPTNVQAVMQLNPAEALDDRRTARRVLIVLGAAVVFFTISHFLPISPAMIALGAAAAALVWVRPEMKKLLARIEWSVLLFFVGLFVMVGGLEAAGVLELDRQPAARSCKHSSRTLRRAAHLAGGRLVCGGGQCSHHHRHDPGTAGAGGGGDEYRPAVVGTGLWGRFRWQRNDHRFHGQYRRGDVIGEDTHPDHFPAVEQARLAGDVGHLPGRQPVFTLAYPWLSK